MIVAIDGPAGSGKSSVARCVAERTGFFYVNSGLFYRAITWAVLEQGADPSDAHAVTAVARGLDLVAGESGLVVDGAFREAELRTARVDEHVAALSSIMAVRQVVNDRVRDAAHERDVVVEGRDMTTVVFPEAEVKIYLDASIESRARRRLSEQGGEGLQQMMARIAERDRIDQEKQFGPLIRSSQAVYIDSSHLTLGQVCDKVLRTIHTT